MTIFHNNRISSVTSELANEQLATDNSEVNIID